MTTIVGRTDSMVKVRGYSVYLGAIEETLRRHCDVADAAVIADAVDVTTKRLIAYVVRGPQAAWRVDAGSRTSRDLRALLERHLPLYSVPSHFVELDSLPINRQTGKLERKALPTLRNGGSDRREAHGVVGPRHAVGETQRPARAVGRNAGRRRRHAGG